MNSFGQEFYPYESIRALRLVARSRLGERRAIQDAIAATLPQPSEKTRQRIANKILQRYISGHRKYIEPPPERQPFVRLLTKQRHVPAQIELLYVELCQTDTLVGALARELFYPIGIENRAPDGLDAAEFQALNGSLLPEIRQSPAPLTRSFILGYARRRWDFSDASSLDRALRVLQGAGLITRERMSALLGHPSAFHITPHEVTLMTFVYALHVEFLPLCRMPGSTLSRNELMAADFVRTLLLSPEQVAAHLEAARRQQLLGGREDEMRLVFGSLDAITDALLIRAI